MKNTHCDTYFAYGSNLNLNDRHRWCDDHGFDRGLLRPLGKAYLPDHELSFSHNSSSRRGGALNVLPSIGNAVEGMLYEVTSEAGWEALDAKEGAPHVYQKTPIVVLDTQRGIRESNTYILREELRHDFVEPAPGYVETVMQGMKGFYTGRRQLQAAAEGKQVPLLTNALFAYGTLMRGESRFDSLKEYQIECALLSAVFGRLVNLGSFPGMLPCEDRNSMVYGDFIKLGDFRSGIGRLDAIEGFRGYGQSGSLYSRRLSVVDMGDGRRRLAWTYIYQGYYGDVIPSGCWRQHHGRAVSTLARIVHDHLENSDRNVFQRLRNQLIWDSFNLRSMADLKSAIASEDLSERILAQASGNWTAFC